MAKETEAVTIRSSQAPADLDLFHLAQQLHQSGYFSDVRSVSQAYVKVLAGRELGIGPIASLRGIHIIQGQPTLPATLMASLIKAHPKYDYKVMRLDDVSCKLEFFEQGQKVGESEFSYANAQTAGLTDKTGSLWPKYRRNMCFARALSNGAKWYCAEVFSGITPYTAEEIRDQPDIKDLDATEVDTTADKIVKPPAQNNNGLVYDAESGKTTVIPINPAPISVSFADAPPADADLWIQYDYWYPISQHLGWPAPETPRNASASRLKAAVDGARQHALKHAKEQTE